MLLKKIRNSRTAKVISSFMALNLIIELCNPLSLYALTGGPSSPEFSSFEPVATTNMVNDFSGDLTYNLPVIEIPGSEGSGYSMSLSYHSGANPEEEASWVGYGWTLNPGAVNRNKRGYPDDWKGKDIDVLNKTKTNKTVTIGGSIGNIEIFSFDVEKVASANVSGSISYNNFKGFGYAAGAGVALAGGVVSLGYNVTNGDGSFSLAVNPAAALGKSDEKAKTNKKKKLKKKQDKFNAQGEKLSKIKDEKGMNKAAAKAGKKGAKMKKVDEMGGNKGKIGSMSLTGSYGIFSFGSVERNNQINSYKGSNFTFSAGLMGTPVPVQIGPTASIYGTYATQEPEYFTKNYPAYGYLYSKQAQSDDNAMMDYYIEKSSPFNKRDKFLGMAFNNADLYTMTGEGVVGGFKASPKNIGYFKPNKVNSLTQFFELGVEFEAGLNFGGGADAGYGQHNLFFEEWENKSTFSNFEDDDEPFVFRFKNDPGGYLLYTDAKNIKAQRAEISFSNNTVGSRVGTASISHIDHSIQALKTEDNGRPSRSTYVGTNTFKKIKSESKNGVYYGKYDKSANIPGEAARLADSDYDDQLAEFSVVNEGGQRYNYGLPVYSKNEKNITIDLVGISGTDIHENYLAHRKIKDNKYVKIGENAKSPYATQYLLTSITTPDYIDRTNDGPTNDDFGGWTKFEYEKVHDDYQWRIPYQGLIYNRNRLADGGDDYGNVVSGEKQVYYLKRVITKTHYADFELSVDPRLDGYGANPDEDEAANGVGSTLQKLKSLKKIKLYSYSGTPDPSNDQLIKTVNFEYNYECFAETSSNPGLFNIKPNTAKVGGYHQGKLTLKKLWFEYNGVYKAKISPYEFNYIYPNVTYPAPYAYLNNHKTGLNETPAYSPFDLDAWGNYQQNGSQRFAKMQKYVNQNPAVTFDPAAWQLKSIKLPSGGEIHAQYEQDEYGYVQDQLAHAMVSMKSVGSDNENGIYALDLTDIGISPGISPELNLQRAQLEKMIRKEYITGGKKMYFKVLYNLLGGAMPELSHCNAEYITGYSNVIGVSVDNVMNSLIISLGDINSTSTHDKPCQVCKEYTKAEAGGKLSVGTSECDPDQDGVQMSGTPEAIMESFIGWIGKSIFPSLVCENFNPGLSYLRIPTYFAKKGGGIRVKRLLMYDQGLDQNQTPEVYGSEYDYSDYDEEREITISSGVAPNEPGSIREENILVGFLDRFKQSFAAKIIAGKDKKQAEGPLGESVLPPPSVGYSKVTVRNIHSGITNTGFKVSRFHTVKEKDFRFKASMTTIDNDNKDYLLIPAGIVNIVTNNLWVSQGFLFETNDMHGKPISNYTYAGEPGEEVIIAGSATEYFDLNEKIPVMYELNNYSDDLPNSSKEHEPLGLDMDMTFETHTVRDHYDNGALEVDVDGGIFGVVVLPFASAIPYLTFTETELYTHTTTKLLHRTSFIKKVTTYTNGISHVSENIKFDPQTGKPIMTRIYDTHDGLDINGTPHKGDYLTVDFPAWMKYKAFDQTAKSERKIISNSNLKREKIGSSYYLSLGQTTGPGLCDLAKQFVAGDLIKLSNGELFYMGELAADGLELHATYINGTSSYASGNVSTPTVEIIRTARNNRLVERAGSFTSYGHTGDSDNFNFPVTTTPISSSEMAKRQSVVNQLNAALNDNTLEIPINQLGDQSLELSIGALGCKTIANHASDYYIKFSGNQFGLFQENVATSPTKVIQGTPQNPHPMVAALNDYLNKYYLYQIDLNQGVTVNCTDNTTFATTSEIAYKGTIPATNASLQAMNADKLSDLSQMFSGVMGGTVPMSSFVEDVALNASSPYTEVAYHTVSGGMSTPNIVENRNAVLHLINLPPPTGSNPPNNQTYIGYHTYCNPSSNEVEVRPGYDFSGFGPNNPLGFRNFPASNSFTQPGLPMDHLYLWFTQTPDGYLGISEEDVVITQQQTDLQFFINDWDVLRCASYLNMKGGVGHFEVDPETAALVYYSDANPCFPQVLDCISFCGEDYPKKSIPNVIATEVNTYSQNWPYTYSKYAPTSGIRNPYECGAKGKWRLQSKYTYKDDVSGSKNYDQGRFANGMDLFNWEILSANHAKKWIPTSVVTKYSPNGNPLEERNVLGINSTAKFGYNKKVPYLLAQNSDYSSALFESFENTYFSPNVQFEDGLVYDTDQITLAPGVAHSGTHSVKLTRTRTGYKLLDLTQLSDIFTHGVSSRVWINTDLKTDKIIDTEDLMVGSFRDASGNFVFERPYKLVTQVGDWSLFELAISEAEMLSNLGATSKFSFYFHYKFSDWGTEKAYIDDIRVQPLASSMTAYLYDPSTFKLIASFDDQNFGLFYQYDAEGKLIRKLVETETGVKTIQETQYNTPLTNR